MDKIVRMRRSTKALVYLASHPGRLISKDELLAAVWPDVVVTEDSLFQCVAELRRALQDHDQHLIKTVAAARLMGTDCIISGIRPQIAQTIVHLGVELNNIITKASLADAFLLALQRNGYVIRKAETR